MKKPLSDLGRIRLRTQDVYQAHSGQWDQHRNRSLMERNWLDRFSSSLPDRGHVLDLGCGSGEPIAKYLVEKNFQVTGLDYAPSMIELARRRLPDCTWLVQDMRSFQLDGQFDGILSWDGFFHLTANEQRSLIPRLHDALRPGGPLLLTVGPRHGEVTGTVAGHLVYHASLSPDEYEHLLEQAGFCEISLTLEDPECGQHSILLARRA